MPPGWSRVRRECLLDAGADEHGIGGRCALDGRPGTVADPLEVDHVRPRELFPHLALDPTNLRAIHRSDNRAQGARLKEALRKRRQGIA